MKKRISLITMLLLLLAAPLSVNAEEYSGGDDWSVTFDGNSMESNFRSTDIDDAVYALQPGDTVSFYIELSNSSDGDTYWYMTNQVLESLEDSQDVASGGAYSYTLTYMDPDGSSEILYSSESVGGETVNESGEGLHQATNSLEDYFYLDQLAGGETAAITLTVTLEGETQGNSYQDTLAKLQMNFAVEPVTYDSTGTPLTGTPYKTGDVTGTLIFVGVACVLGILCLILAVRRILRERRHQK